MKRIIKKLSPLLLCLTLILCFASCNKPPVITTDKTPEVTKKPVSTTAYERYEPEDKQRSLILNVKSKKIHDPECSFLPSKENALEIDADDLYKYPDYKPCSHCQP